MMVRRPSTVGELISLRHTIDRVFDDPFVRAFPVSRATRRMPMDVIDTSSAIEVEAALPGISPDDIEVSMLGDVLTVAAGRDAQDVPNEGGYQVREVRKGRVVRSLSLPTGLRVDEATASFEHGLLRVSIPKATAAMRRVIPITAPVAASVVDAAPVDDGAVAPVDGGTTDADPVASAVDAAAATDTTSTPEA